MSTNEKITESKTETVSESDSMTPQNGSPLETNTERVTRIASSALREALSNIPGLLITVYPSPREVGDLNEVIFKVYVPLVTKPSEEESDIQISNAHQEIDAAFNDFTNAEKPDIDAFKARVKEMVTDFITTRMED